MEFYNGKTVVNRLAVGALLLLMVGAAVGAAVGLAGCASAPPAVPGTQGAPSGADPERADRLRIVLPVSAPTAMAVTANAHATRTAVEVMKAGGNAIDAAVAAQFVLNVVEPQSSGIGGGGFLVAYLSQSRRVVAIDGREELPAGARLADFLSPDGKPLPFFPDRITGGLAVGVPGLLKMLELALERYGTWPLSRVLQPAIRLAHEGFPVSRRLAESLRRHEKRLGRFPATRAVFFAPGGRTLQTGAWLRQPDLAGTFRLLASEGSAPFYRGEIGRELARAVREAPVAPGRMTLADLAAYRAVFRRPVRSSYRGYTLYGMGPPSSGAATVFQLLNLMETQPVSPAGPYAAMAIHRFVLASRLAFADRGAFLADADFQHVPIAGLLDKAYARRRAASVDWGAPLLPVRAGTPPGALGLAPGRSPSHESRSTTHLSIMDSQGNMVAMTTSVEQAFGSAMVVPGRGFLLNNQLTDFAMRRIDGRGRLIANRLETGRKPRRTALEHPRAMGGKRPRSSMAPTLVLKDGKPVLVAGSPGGSRIIQFVAEVMIRVLDYGMAPQEAVQGPHHTHGRGVTWLEPALKRTGVAAALEKLGHKVRFRDQGSGLHVIWRDPRGGRLHGGVDPRREGLAAGY